MAKTSESSSISTDILEDNILPCLEQTGRSSMDCSLQQHYQEMDLKMRLSEIEHDMLSDIENEESPDILSRLSCSNNFFFIFLLFAYKNGNAIKIILQK